MHRVLPSCLEGEVSGITSIASQGAEWPGEQFGTGLANIPEVNVLLGNLHHALSIDVQVGAR